MAGKRTSVLVFFEERIQQRDQDCEADTAFMRSKVYAEEHMGKLAELAAPNRGGLDRIYGAVFQVFSSQSSCLCPYLA